MKWIKGDNMIEEEIMVEKENKKITEIGVETEIEMMIIRKIRIVKKTEKNQKIVTISEVLKKENIKMKKRKNRKKKKTQRNEIYI